MIIGLDNSLVLTRREAIIWTNAGILYCTLKKKLQWNFNWISDIFIQENAFETVVCEMAPFCFRLNVLRASQNQWWPISVMSYGTIMTQWVKFKQTWFEYNVISNFHFLISMRLLCLPDLLSITLTHLLLVPHLRKSVSGQHWFR